MPREILSLREFPRPRQHVRHIFVQFIPHIRHMNVKFHSLFQFVFGGIIWLETSVGTIPAWLLLLSRAESSYLYLVSFPCHFSSPSVSQRVFYCALARVVFFTSFFPPISSPSSVVALGLGCCKINVRVKCSSEAHFSASLMIE